MILRYAYSLHERAVLELVATDDVARGEVLALCVRALRKIRWHPTAGRDAFCYTTHTVSDAVRGLAFRPSGATLPP